MNGNTSDDGSGATGTGANTAEAALPNIKVDTTPVANKEQFAFWRDYLNEIVVADVSAEYTAPFIAYDNVFATSSVVYSESKVLNTWNMNRTKQQAENADSEEMCFQFCEEVTEIGNSFKNDTKFVPGNVRIIDFNQPFSLSYMHYDAKCMMVSKKHLRDRIPNLESLHGMTIGPSAIASYLITHIRAVYEMLPHLTFIEAEQLSDITLETLNACLMTGSRPNIVESEQLDTTNIRAIRNYIKDTMQDPQLSPEKIAQAMGMSRSKLFRLCQPYGTPMEMVRRLRLIAARRLLMAGTGMSVEEIAYQIGYENRSSFSRAFKAEFGISAREVAQLHSPIQPTS